MDTHQAGIISFSAVSKEQKKPTSDRIKSENNLFHQYAPYGIHNVKDHT